MLLLLIGTQCLQVSGVYAHGSPGTGVFFIYFSPVSYPEDEHSPSGFHIYDAIVPYAISEHSLKLSRERNTFMWICSQLLLYLIEYSFCDFPPYLLQIFADGCLVFHLTAQGAPSAHFQK
mgnify:CR=1 FL=1